jgi:hypothetical protein
MRGALPPLPNTPSWRGAQLKYRDNFTVTFTFTIDIARAHGVSGPTECVYKSLAIILRCIERIVLLDFIYRLVSQERTKLRN